MDDNYHITHVEEPGGDEWRGIGGGIRGYNTQEAGEDNYRHVCFMLYGPDQEIVGGVIGATEWDWFHMDLLWVKEELRGRGYGHLLLTRAEEEARKQGARNAYLDTFSFQAPDFYAKHGYQVFGELPDFPAGHRRFFMTKQLQ